MKRRKQKGKPKGQSFGDADVMYRVSSVCSTSARSSSSSGSSVAEKREQSRAASLIGWCRVVVLFAPIWHGKSKVHQAGPNVNPFLGVSRGISAVCTGLYSCALIRAVVKDSAKRSATRWEQTAEMIH
jgi:hypothetical protein